MTERNIGMEILEGIKEIKKHKEGDIQLKVTTLTDPSPAQVIRKN
jgi:putative transcriptional regulator